jgi:hypothetical protein
MPKTKSPRRRSSSGRQVRVEPYAKNGSAKKKGGRRRGSSGGGGDSELDRLRRENEKLRLMAENERLKRRVAEGSGGRREAREAREADLAPSVRRRLRVCYGKKFLRKGDIDGRTYALLCRYHPEDAVAAIDLLDDGKRDPTSVRSMSKLLSSLLRRFRKQERGQRGGGRRGGERGGGRRGGERGGAGERGKKRSPRRPKTGEEMDAEMDHYWNIKGKTADEINEMEKSAALDQGMDAYWATKAAAAPAAAAAAAPTDAAADAGASEMKAEVAAMPVDPDI